MLAYHCPDCGIPLFKYEGKVICPVCKREAEIVGEGRDAVVRMKGDAPKDTKVEKEEVKVSHTSDVEEAVIETIRILANRLKEVSTTEDVKILKDFVNILKDLIDILDKIKNLKI